MFDWFGLIFLITGLVDADIQFISSVNDYNLNCNLQANAGNMIALLQNTEVNGRQFQVARIDTSSAQSTIFLLNNATYDNLQLTTFIVDPVLKRVSVVTNINNANKMIFFSTINGSLINEFIISQSVSMMAIDLFDSTIYGLSNYDGFVHLVTVDIETQSIIKLLNTTAIALQPLTQSIDFNSRIYTFIGIDNFDDVVPVSKIFKINLVNLEISSIPLSSRIFPITTYNGNIVAFIPFEQMWKLGLVNFTDATFTYLHNSSIIEQFIDVPRAFDLVNNIIYGPLLNTSVINIYSIKNGTLLSTSELPTGYRIHSAAFEQECICCLQTIQSVKKELFNLKLLNSNLAQFTDCHSSSASQIQIGYILVLSIFLRMFF